jgi:hypothetical protein
MIRRNTWILLVLLVALVGFYFWLKDRQAKQAALATPTPGVITLFSAAAGTPTDIKLESALGSVVDFGRDQSGTWVVKAPSVAAANQANAEAAAIQVGALRVLANIQLGPDVVGLDKPSNTMTVTYVGGQTHKLLVGSVTPIQNGYYAQLDGGPIQVVDKIGMDALLGLLTNPPYLATLTPSASPTPPPAPATDTPEGPSTQAPAALTPPAGSPTTTSPTVSAPKPGPTSTP